MARHFDQLFGPRPLSRRKRRKRRLLWLALCAALAAAGWLGGPYLAARALALPQWALERMAPHFEARLDALRQETRTLRTALADAALLEQENQALRDLLQSPSRPQSGTWLPARVVARSPSGMTLYCADAAPRPGVTVLDRYGHYAGVVTSADGHTAAVQLPGSPACLAGDAVGVLEVTADGWRLAGVALPTTLRAGMLVTTPDGAWVGLLAQDPVTDPGGLTAHAALLDTAVLTDPLYFVAIP